MAEQVEVEAVSERPKLSTELTGHYPKIWNILKSKMTPEYYKGLKKSWGAENSKGKKWDGRIFWQFCIYKKCPDTGQRKDHREKLEENLTKLSFGKAENSGSTGLELKEIDYLFEATAFTYKIYSLEVLLELYFMYCDIYDLEEYVVGLEGRFGITHKLRDRYKYEAVEGDQFRFVLNQARKNSLPKKPERQASKKQRVLTPEKKSGFQINLERPPIRENVLSYFGNQRIDILGREKEQTQLKEFLLHEDTDKPFLWFQIAGVAGQGKSRLALDLIELADSQEEKWNAGLINDDELQQLNDNWDEWQPDRPHLLVLDYVVGRVDAIHPVFKRFCSSKNKFEHSVRLLLVERQPWNQGISWRMETPSKRSTSDEIRPSIDIGSTRAEWFLNFAERPDGDDVNLSKARFKAGVLTLDKLNSDKLVDIVEQVAAIIPDSKLKRLDDSARQKIAKQLEKIDEGGSPLYAYFLAEELAAGINTQGWGREDLLTVSLDRERTRWWLGVFKNTPPLLEEDTPAARLALLATMTGTFDCMKAIEGKVIKNIKPKARQQAAVMTGQISSNLFTKKIAPPQKIEGMQPDLLGEWYVLSCFEEGIPIKELTDIAWQHAPEKMSAFIQRIYQDFRGRSVVGEILDTVDLDGLDEKVLSRCANALMVHWNEKSAVMPHKVIEALKLSAKNKNKNTIYNLGLYYQKLGAEPDTAKAVEYYQQAAELGHADAMNNLGVCYADGVGVKQDEAKAVECYQQAEELGHAGAMNNLGVCYVDGRGVEPDEVKAVEYYQQAAELGHSNAIFNLGVRFSNGRGVELDEARAVECWQQASELGHAYAMFNLGVRFSNGRGVEPDEAKAVEYYQQAAELGHAGAMNNLGACYAHGVGVKQDEAKAVEYYQQAVQLDHLDGMYNLGWCYFNGRGVEPDEMKAVEYYQQAAELGHVSAMFNLGVCYADGVGVKQDEAKAVESYRQAVELGHVNAMYNLGFSHFYGIGVKQDKTKAVKYWQQAAELDLVDAMHTLGICYANGEGVEADEARALEYWEQASELGYADAMFNLGICYASGKCVEPDEEKAVEYYQQAAELGHVNAMNNLGICYADGKGVELDEARAVEYWQQASELGHADAMNNLGICYADGVGVEQDEAKAVEYWHQAAELGHEGAISNLSDLEQ